VGQISSAVYLVNEQVNNSVLKKGLMFYTLQIVILKEKMNVSFPAMPADAKIDSKCRY
jgi:hypothetical protein